MSPDGSATLSARFRPKAREGEGCAGTPPTSSGESVFAEVRLCSSELDVTACHSSLPPTSFWSRPVRLCGRDRNGRGGHRGLSGLVGWASSPRDACRSHPPYSTECSAREARSMRYVASSVRRSGRHAWAKRASAKPLSVAFRSHSPRVATSRRPSSSMATAQHRRPCGAGLSGGGMRAWSD